MPLYVQDHDHVSALKSRSICFTFFYKPCVLFLSFLECGDQKSHPLCQDLYISVNGCARQRARLPLLISKDDVMSDVMRDVMRDVTSMLNDELYDE